MRNEMEQELPVDVQAGIIWQPPIKIDMLSPVEIDMLIVGEAATRRSPADRTVLMFLSIANSIPNVACHSDGEVVWIDLATTRRA
jgi:hypothetical protein